MRFLVGATAFRELGPQNAEVRRCLSSHLPNLIQHDPKKNPHVWINSVRLAGEFQIVETIPSLAKWIGLFVGSLQGATLTSEGNLDPFPAGKALAQIGDPSIPTLIGILKTEQTHERYVACRALMIIGSSQALNALRAHLKQESDPELRHYIERALDRK